MRASFIDDTLPFDLGPRASGLDLRIDAMRLAVDVHLATLQLPEHERPYLGERLHTTARAVARRLARAKIAGVSRARARSLRSIAELTYMLCLARDLGWLSAAVVRTLCQQAEALREALAGLPGR